MIQLRYKNFNERNEKMANIYDYKENIKVITTPKGDKVITMNDEIFTMLCNRVWEASESQREHNLLNTAKDTLKLWEVLRNN